MGIHEAVTSDTESVLELVACHWKVPNEVVPKLAGIARACDIGVPGSAVRCWVARKTMEGVHVIQGSDPTSTDISSPG